MQAVLNVLRDGTSRDSAQIGGLLGIHSSTVARLMYALEMADLVRGKGKRRPTSVGRPRKLWSLNREAGFVLGLAVHPMTLRGVLVDLSGAVVARRTISFDPPLMADALVDAVRDLALSLTDGAPSGRILGVGAGVSGVVDPEAGVVRFSGGLLTAPGVFATDYPLRTQLEQVLPWPMQLANDANLGALAAFRGQVQSGDLPVDGSLLYAMAVESLWGFGAGVIVGGRLHQGARGAAGELLHPRLLSAPPDWADLPRRALAGDPEARSAVIEALRPMLEHLVALALTVDTHRLVLGGAFAALGRPLQPTLAEMMTATPGFGKHLADLPERGIVLDPQWPDTVALGAAELALQGVFREPMARETGPLVRIALGATARGSARLGEPGPVSLVG